MSRVTCRECFDPNFSLIRKFGRPRDRACSSIGQGRAFSLCIRRLLVSTTTSLLEHPTILNHIPNHGRDRRPCATRGQLYPMSLNTAQLICIFAGYP
jgi:hypothetical protein